MHGRPNATHEFLQRFILTRQWWRFSLLHISIWTEVCFLSVASSICSGVTLQWPSPQTLLPFRHCTSIDGSLRVIYLTDACCREANCSLPNLVEIVGALVIEHSTCKADLSRFLPQLTVIRGWFPMSQQVLSYWEEYPLVIRNTALASIGLHQLRHLGKLRIALWDNPSLCYVNSVHWASLTLHSSEVESDKSPINSPHSISWLGLKPFCLDVCPNKCYAKETQPSGCWSDNVCQIECGHVVIYKMSDLDQVRGCSSVTSLVISLEECYGFLDLDRGGPDEDVGFGSTSFRSLNSRSDHRAISPINPVSFRMPLFHIPDTSEVDLYAAFENLQEIFGSLRVLRSDSLSSLNFLRHLRAIRGLPVGETTKEPRTAVEIVWNRRLKHLWNVTGSLSSANRVVVPFGSLMFSLNPNLCPEAIRAFVDTYIQMDRHLTALELELIYSSNGETAVCIVSPIVSDNHTGGGQFYCHLDELKAASLYEAFIEIRTILNREGASSPWFRFNTLPNTPSVPLLLSAYPTGPYTVRLSWSPPVDPNGVIIAYQLWYRAMPVEISTELQRRAQTCTSVCGEHHNSCLTEWDFYLTLQGPTPLVPSSLTDVISPNGRLLKPFAYLTASLLYDDSPAQFIRLPAYPTEVVVNGLNHYTEYLFGVSACHDPHDELGHPLISVIPLQIASMLLYILSLFLRIKCGETSCVKDPQVSSLELTKAIAEKDTLDTTFINVTVSDASVDADQKTVDTHYDSRPTQKSYSSSSTTHPALASFHVEFEWLSPPHPNGVVLFYWLRYRRVTGTFTDQDLSVVPFTYLPERIFLPLALCLVVLLVTGSAAVWATHRSLRRRLTRNTSMRSEFHEPLLSGLPHEWELTSKDVYWDAAHALGEGSFGTVYSGILQTFTTPGAKQVLQKLRVSSGMRPVKRLAVAIKPPAMTFRGRQCLTIDVFGALPESGGNTGSAILNSSPYDIREFMNEAAFMKNFSNDHIVQMLGILVHQSSHDKPPALVMELMSLGDLATFLRQRLSDEDYAQGSVKPSLAVNWATQIAGGMAYLSSLQLIHRDLAARNCLVNDSLTVKIADGNHYYRKRGRARLPIRWMSPEALASAYFTIQSDVWSYGVVIWEIVTFAALPFSGLSHEEVIVHVTGGGRLEVAQWPTRLPSDL
ncbi:hypothetical protein T265_08938 [Opisthorchis viverrini]|uniref:receptor protein-tyrosine kinase n=1 Tax=Opisthorchis viverrini TaxID=6198 RepID=A0A074ZC07_OPIVI|nr:hypothetical protein T265_08938 [Opisthorchis viverrini]KER23132.1 hypothetical protein T265_08938 [Opisthorchis viverrini]